MSEKRLTKERLEWWASRLYDAQEFYAYTVNTNGVITEESWIREDPLEQTLKAFMTELGLGYPIE